MIATIVSSLVWILNRWATGLKMVNLESENADVEACGA